jgi:hypothetical protein
MARITRLVATGCMATNKGQNHGTNGNSGAKAIPVQTRFSIRYNGVELTYRTFDKIRHVEQGAIADNKRLGPILAMIRDEQLRRGPERRSGPRRRDQRDTRLFKIG